MFIKRSIFVTSGSYFSKTYITLLLNANIQISGLLTLIEVYGYKAELVFIILVESTGSEKAVCQSLTQLNFQIPPGCYYCDTIANLSHPRCKRGRLGSRIQTAANYKARIFEPYKHSLSVYRTYGSNRLRYCLSELPNYIRR